MLGMEDGFQEGYKIGLQDGWSKGFGAGFEEASCMQRQPIDERRDERKYISE